MRGKEEITFEGLLGGGGGGGRAPQGVRREGAAALSVPALSCLSLVCACGRGVGAFLCLHLFLVGGHAC